MLNQYETARKIIHVDMDAFYASVEQRDNPVLRGKPVAVGGDGHRGVVAAASYEARKFGVRSAMSSLMARQRCPELIFVPTNINKYRDISLTIRNIFRDYTDLIEPLSLDEAYLDVTANKAGIPSATLIAKEIKARIKVETQLTASAGVSVNKFLAKIASDYDKPDGLYVITPDQVVEFVEKLPVEKFFGVGKVTARKMHEIGVKNGLDLKKKELPQLLRVFGKQGQYFFDIARGTDNRPVNPHRIRKSVGAEHTYTYDISTEEGMAAKLALLAEELALRVNRNKFRGKTLTLKIKYTDFKQVTRSKTVPQILLKEKEIYALAMQLLQQSLLEKAVRLLGISVSNAFEEQADAVQLTLNF